MSCIDLLCKHTLPAPKVWWLFKARASAANQASPCPFMSNIFVLGVLKKNTYWDNCDHSGPRSRLPGLWRWSRPRSRHRTSRPPSQWCLHLWTWKNRKLRLKIARRMFATALINTYSEGSRIRTSHFWWRWSVILHLTALSVGGDTVQLVFSSSQPVKDPRVTRAVW